MSKGIFLLLGTNQGSKTSNLKEACEAIIEVPASVTNRSSIYRTAAWGKTDQEDFYNQVIEIETSLSPEDLLTRLLSIEEKMGRRRTEKWGPRLIDIDILFYGDQIINTSTLTIPHPGIPTRKFTLVPLVELVPSLIHPVSQKKLSTLLNECADPLTVVKV
jgi:2-amino-4-hydroxy-6-hydroxymethyldihydropteridine diphosphokinase